MSDDFESDVAARGRRWARRTRWVAVVAAALLVAAVPLGLAAVHRGTASQQRPAARPSATPPVSPPATGYAPAPDGWRWESQGGLQALVPDSWGYGVDLDSRCNRSVAEGAPGAVEVPGRHTLVGCLGPEPRSHYMAFLRFGGLDPQAPARNGRWRTEEIRVGRRRVVTVRGDDPEVVDRIVGSVSVVEGADRNGCPLRHPAGTDRGWRPDPVDGVEQGTPDVVSVCRYGSVDLPDDGDLTFSTVLTPGRAAAVLDSLRSAPADRGPDEPGRCLAHWGESVTVLRARFPAGWQEYVVRFDGCGHHGTDDGTTRRELTRDVARAALIGYRGALGRQVYRLTGNWFRDNTR